MTTTCSVNRILQISIQYNNSASDNIVTDYPLSSQINIQSPVAEIKAAIKKLKNNKAAETDNIALELFKTDPTTTAGILATILEAWNTNNIPRTWKQGLIITIPKKGDLYECRN